MYIELYKFVEGDEKCEKGEYLGYVSLEEDDVYIDVDSDELAEKLEELFSEPIYASSEAGLEQEFEPYTLEFFRNVLLILPDYDVRGCLKEAEEGESILEMGSAITEEEPIEGEAPADLTLGMEMEGFAEEGFEIEEEEEGVELEEEAFDKEEELDEMEEDEYED